MTPKLVKLKNNASVEVHGIPAGAEMNVRANADGSPVKLEQRKRLADGTFSVVKKAPAAAKKAKE